MRLILFVLLLIGNLSVSLAVEMQPLPAAYKFGVFPCLSAVRLDSPLKNVNDLKGKIITTPSAFVPVVQMARHALKKTNLQLRTLLKTPSIPNLSIVVHSRVPAEQRERLKQILLSWQNNNSGKKLLNRMKTQGFIPALDKEYDAVRTFLREIDGK